MVLFLSHINFWSTTPHSSDIEGRYMWDCFLYPLRFCKWMFFFYIHFYLFICCARSYFLHTGSSGCGMWEFILPAGTELLHWELGGLARDILVNIPLDKNRMLTNFFLMSSLLIFWNRDSNWPGRKVQCAGNISGNLKGCFQLRPILLKILASLIVG